MRSIVAGTLRPRPVSSRPSGRRNVISSICLLTAFNSLSRSRPLSPYFTAPRTARHTGPLTIGASRVVAVFGEVHLSTPSTRQAPYLARSIAHFAVHEMPSTPVVRRRPTSVHCSTHDPQPCPFVCHSCRLVPHLLLGGQPCPRVPKPPPAESLHSFRHGRENVKKSAPDSQYWGTRLTTKRATAD